MHPALRALTIYLGGYAIRKMMSSDKKEITWENDKEWETRFFKLIKKTHQNSSQITKN